MRAWCALGLVCSVLVAGVATLTPEGTGWRWGDPLTEVRWYATGLGSPATMVQLFGNLALLAGPAAFAVRIWPRLGRRPVLIAVAVAAGGSIETLQWLLPIGRVVSPIDALLGAVVGAALAVEVTAITPTFTAALSRLQLADPAWAAVAVVAAAASMSFFARTRGRLMAAAGVRVRQRDALAAVYVANAVHVTVPGGAAFSTAWTYRWMRARGASAGVITWTLVTGGVLCSSALALIALVGSLLLGHGPGPAGLLVDGLSVVLLVSAATLARRHPELLGAAAARGARLVDRVLRRPAGQSENAARTLLAQLTAVHPRPIDWSAAAAYALANWLLDAGCLWAGGLALGVHLSIPVLLLCYAAGMAAAGLSVVPAGIGLVDGAMVLVLTAAGLPAATALPVVLLYRLISLVGVVAAGWVIAAAQTFAPRVSVRSPWSERPRTERAGSQPVRRRKRRPTQSACDRVGPFDRLVGTTADAPDTRTTTSVVPVV